MKTIERKNIKKERICINCKRKLRSKYVVHHHLIPAQILREKNLINKLRGNTILLCKPCEFYLHYLYDNKELEDNINTIEKILSDGKMKLFAEWIYDKPYVSKKQIKTCILNGLIMNKKEEIMKHILFVCKENLKRSPPFERFFKNKLKNTEVRSAGIYYGYPYQVNQEILKWADKIYVMDLSQSKFIKENYPSQYKKVEVIGISDEYNPDDDGLIDLIKFWWEDKIRNLSVFLNPKE